jgi:hypothetical protein
MHIPLSFEDRTGHLPHLLHVALLITVLSYVLDPGQGQFTHRNLSAAAEKNSIPVSAICGLIWILLTVRTRRGLNGLITRYLERRQAYDFSLATNAPFSEACTK